MNVNSKELIRNYRIISSIGRGSFGQVYMAAHKDSGLRVALKLESNTDGSAQLKFEYQLYKLLNSAIGIPQVYDFFEHSEYNVLVMELLGPSLEDLFQLCSRRFSLKTVLILAIKMLNQIEYVHKKGYVHRDIKPDNFVIGPVMSENQLYIIDFGLAKQYIGKENKHINLGWCTRLTGTPRYASLNALRGFELSRRDDMISLGNVWMYFLRGSLPWQGLKKPNTKTIIKIRQSTLVEDLCSGYPEEFANYFKYCESLKFQCQPNYGDLRRQFSDLFTRLNYVNDGDFDWIKSTRTKESSTNTKD